MEDKGGEKEKKECEGRKIGRRYIKRWVKRERERER